MEDTHNTCGNSVLADPVCMPRGAADPRPPRDDSPAFVEWLLRRYWISDWDNEFIRRLKLVLKRDNDGNLLPEGKVIRSEQKGIAVTGRSQDGKTTLVCQVLKRLFGDSFTEDKCGEKIVYCRLRGEATIKSVSQALCRKTGYDGFSDRMTRAETHELAVHRLRLAGIKIVIIDEVHNLLGNKREPADLYLKSLAQEQGFCVILIGTLKARDFIYGDPDHEELAERFYDLPLIPFERPKAIELINGALHQFSRDSGVKLGPGIRNDPYFADRIYDGVQGSFGRCMVMIASAIVFAHEEGSSTVDVEDFREFYQLKYARLSPENPFVHTDWSARVLATMSTAPDTSNVFFDDDAAPAPPPKRRRGRKKGASK